MWFDWLTRGNWGGACATPMVHGAVGQREDLFLDTTHLVKNHLYIARLSLFVFSSAFTPLSTPFAPRPVPSPI